MSAMLEHRQNPDNTAQGGSWAGKGFICLACRSSQIFDVNLVQEGMAKGRRYRFVSKEGLRMGRGLQNRSDRN